MDRRVGGLHAGSAGYVYAVTGAGQRLLDLPGARRRLAEPSLPFVEHTLAIAELFVRLHLEARSRAADPDRSTVELLDVQTEPDCWRSWTGLGGERQVLRPDLYLAAAIGSEEVRWFAELDRGSEHRPALVRKCRAYQAYYEAGVEQQREGVFPRVAWLVPDDRRAEQLRAALASDARLDGRLFAVILHEDSADQLLT